jgi:hypothetical protein
LTNSNSMSVRVSQIHWAHWLCFISVSFESDIESELSCSRSVGSISVFLFFFALPPDLVRPLFTAREKIIESVGDFFCFCIRRLLDVLRRYSAIALPT